jgi:glycosyltransferase involved in cell wall biosynthesis
MKIGIDVTLLEIRSGRHGIGAYLRGLLGALGQRDTGHDFFLFAHGVPDLGVGTATGRFRVVRLPSPPLGRAQALVSHQVLLPWLARRLALDVLHLPGVSVNASMPALPLWRAVRMVVTVHDLSPLHFPREILPGARHRVFYRVMLGAVRRAAHLLSDSRATRNDLVTLLGVPVSRITIAPLAADPCFTPSPVPLEDARGAPLADGGYVLHVGGPVPMKNLPRLLSAMVELWARASTAAPLVCVSSLPFDPVALCPAVARHRARVHVLTDVDSRFLVWLYQHASCLAFPSLYEGFGLPVLEAMASGCPVVASRVASLPEVGGDAAVYVEPRDVDAIRLALHDVVGDTERRREMRASGLAQAGRFSYAATAVATLGAYEAGGRSVTAA